MRPTRGSFALEFALTLPVWFAMMVFLADAAWFVFHIETLDAAATDGCRAGALIDPGEEDQRLADVIAAARARMLATLETLGAGEGCPSCTLTARTVGAPPRRSLVCVVTREVEPVAGLFFDARRLESRVVTRLEWQREEAPE